MNCTKSEGSLKIIRKGAVSKSIVNASLSVLNNQLD